MPGPYPCRDVDILLAQSKQHAEHLRHTGLFDIRLVGGFITAQFVFAGWFAASSVPKGLWTTAALIVIDFVMLGGCIFVLNASDNRRKQVGNVLRNINSALGLNRPGYLPGGAIIPDEERTYPFWWYALSCIASFIAAAFVVLEKSSLL
ncbi:MAG TPA: hypothetical protein VNZ53_04120 [Steroidobacteraceae bacterium]|jgi:hypothetical protein|nr:hypothetical protein [Steroidobacteraceae bacterium]